MDVGRPQAASRRLAGIAGGSAVVVGLLAVGAVAAGADSHADEGSTPGGHVQGPAPVQAAVVADLRPATGPTVAASRRASGAPPHAATCRSSDLYGSIDAAVAESGFTYEVSLTNVGAHPCTLPGAPLGLATATGAHLPARLDRGPFSDDHRRGAAAPGEPLHLTIHEQASCATPAARPPTGLAVRLPDGVVTVATHMVRGGLRWPCPPSYSPFFGPISALTGRAPAPLPVGARLPGY